MICYKENTRIGVILFIKTHYLSALFGAGASVSALKLHCVRLLAFLRFFHHALNISWLSVLSLTTSILLVVGGILFAKAVPFSSVDFMLLLVGGSGYFLLVAMVMLITVLGESGLWKE